MCRTDFDGYDEEETVKVVFRGNQEPVSIELTQDALDCQGPELEKRITEAMKDAHEKCACRLNRNFYTMQPALWSVRSSQWLLCLATSRHRRRHAVWRALLAGTL